MLGKVLHTLIDWTIRDMPGGLGQRVRAAYWRRRFRACGRVRIDEGVTFHNPGQIEIGTNVWIMAYSVLTAPAAGQAEDDARKNISGTSGGLLKIGDEVQVGLYNVLNANGGLTIGDCATLSARVTIYSATHLPRDPEDPAQKVGCNGMVRRRPVHSMQRPVTIGEGAWLGLNTTVICADVGADAFVKTGALVTRDLPAGQELDAQGRTRARYGERTPA